MNESTKGKTIAYFDKKLAEYGTTPKGVDWKDRESQFLRFDQLLKLLPLDTPFSLNDLGCGYGAFLPYALSKGYQIKKYNGYDISAKMLAESRSFIRKYPPVTMLVLSDRITFPADYSICSGTFNLKADEPDTLRTHYVLTALDNMFEYSRIGFAFNCLTTEDLDFRVDNLYYADPHFYLSYCREQFSDDIELMEHYGLYEWTMLVKKEV